MVLLLLSTAPVVIILFYVYFRDKYEHEPLGMLLKALLAGGLITIPVAIAETILTALGHQFGDPATYLFWDAFVVAGFTEELFKFGALFIIIWTNRNFNEKFDGIVYAVFISLGFALIENLLYVFNGGIQVAWSRALTAVPAHALFGIVMGYYFGIARFRPSKTAIALIRALIAPVVLHGIYDFILMSGIPFLLILFLPYILYLWMGGFRKMKELSDSSLFRYKNIQEASENGFQTNE